MHTHIFRSGSKIRNKLDLLVYIKLKKKTNWFIYIFTNLVQRFRRMDYQLYGQGPVSLLRRQIRRKFFHERMYVCQHYKDVETVIYMETGSL